MQKTATLKAYSLYAEDEPLATNNAKSILAAVESACGFLMQSDKAKKATRFAMVEKAHKESNAYVLVSLVDEGRDLNFETVVTDKPCPLFLKELKKRTETADFMLLYSPQFCAFTPQFVVCIANGYIAMSKLGKAIAKRA